jgi:hypothetical protein
MAENTNRYTALIEWVFFRNYVEGASQVAWERKELEDGAAELGIELPKNLGDVVYSVRYRTSLPATVTAKAPAGKH